MRVEKTQTLGRAPALSRQFDLGAVLAHDNARLAPCDAASYIVLVDKLWDVPMRPSAAEDKKDVLEAVRRACRSLQVDTESAAKASHEALGSLSHDRRHMKEQPFWKATQTAYNAYTADMTADVPDVLVPDDKQKKFMWRMPLVCYYWLLLKFAMVSPAWELSALRLEDAEAWCQEVFRILLPARLKMFLKITCVWSSLHQACPFMFAENCKFL